MEMSYGDAIRWSSEIHDCSMPLSFDTYTSCGYNCLYCFAFFQKDHLLEGYKKVGMGQREVRSVHPGGVKKMFINCLMDKPKLGGEKQYYPYIKNRITMQWGGMADGFDENERKHGVSLELLKFFDKIDYPLSISTKGTWWTKDKRYMELFERHPHNWHVKMSIITLDKEKARKMEEFCPSPQERINAIKRLSDIGIHCTLRLRPYIVGLSEDYPQLIHEASEAGADSVTTEFFCLEQRADERLKLKYKQMSEIVGYDIWEFYKKHSTHCGYLRLNYKMKRPIIKNMKKIAHKHKMLFYVSDAHHKEKCDAVCCCGTPPSFKVFEGHFNKALQIAKQRKDHTVRWSDINPQLQEIVGHIRYVDALNTQDTRQRAMRIREMLPDFLLEAWNNPKHPKSPYVNYDGILYPIGLDEQNNVIYKLNTKKMRR